MPSSGSRSSAAPDATCASSPTRRATTGTSKAKASTSASGFGRSLPVAHRHEHVGPTQQGDDLGLGHRLDQPDVGEVELEHLAPQRPRVGIGGPGPGDDQVSSGPVVADEDVEGLDEPVDVLLGRDLADEQEHRPLDHRRQVVLGGLVRRGGQQALGAHQRVATRRASCGAKSSRFSRATFSLITSAAAVSEGTGRSWPEAVGAGPDEISTSRKPAWSRRKRR